MSDYKKKISRPEIAAMFKYGGMRMKDYVKDGQEKVLFKVRIQLEPGVYEVKDGDDLILVAWETKEKREDWHDDFFFQIEEDKQNG